MPNDLLAVRTRLVKLSGRTDLVLDEENYGDNGADDFIRDACKWLDNRMGKFHDELSVEFSLTAGQYYVDLSNVRAVETVELEYGEGHRYLKRETLRELRSRFTGDDNSFSDVSQGEPAYYSITNRRLATPTTQDDESKVRLIFLPPSEGSQTLRVNGLFYSNALTVNTSYNWWTVNHPGILVKAAMYQLEVFYNNREGQQNWLASLELDLQGLDANAAAQASADVNNMRDSW